MSIEAILRTVLMGGFGGAAIGLLYVICGKVGRIELHLGKIAEKS